MKLILKLSLIFIPIGCSHIGELISHSYITRWTLKRAPLLNSIGLVLLLIKSSIQCHSTVDWFMIFFVRILDSINGIEIHQWSQIILQSAVVSIEHNFSNIAIQTLRSKSFDQTFKCFFFFQFFILINNDFEHFLDVWKIWVLLIRDRN